MHARAILFLTAALWLAIPDTSEAFGGRLFSQSNRTTVSYYYYPVYPAVAPIYAPTPAVAVPAPIPVPATQLGTGAAPGTYAPPPTQGFAAPSPAPPSGAPFPTTNPPPLAAPRPTPQVNESRYGGTMTTTAARISEAPPTSRCSVAFWNLTDRPLVFRIEGNSYVVDRNQKVALDLPHTFVWQIEGRDLQTERVPSSEKTLDLVVRR